MISYKKLLAVVLAIYILPFSSLPVAALESADLLANPDGVTFNPAVPVPGFTNATNNVTIISNGTPNTINRLQWSDFDVPVNQTLNFQFTAANQAILNYVPTPTGADTWSIIRGRIETTGQPGTLMLVNPNGVFVREGSFVALNDGDLFVSDMRLVGNNIAAVSTDINTNIAFEEYSFTANVGGNTFSNLTNGVDFENTSSINGFDRITMYADGIRIGIAAGGGSTSTISANDNVQILTAGDANYNVGSDTFSNIQGSTIPNPNICYDSGVHLSPPPNPPGLADQYSDTYANFTLGPTSSISVSSGNVSITNISNQDKIDSSIDIQGTINANATAAGEGEITLFSENRNADQIGFINIPGTGVLNSTAPCPITPPVTLTGDEIRSRDYNVSFADDPFIQNNAQPNPGEPTSLPAGPTAIGTINMKEFPDLTLTSATQTFPNTVTGVNQRTVDLGVGATEGQLEVNLDPCIIPPPPDGGGGLSGGAITAIAVGSAGALGAASLLSTLPLLAKKPPTIYQPIALRPCYVCPQANYAYNCPSEQMRPYYYDRTTGAAAELNEQYYIQGAQPQQGYYYYPQEQTQPLPSEPEE